MELTDALAYMNSAIMLMLRLSLPMLLMGMLIGLIISIFQAATQIHEQTITFVPKLIVTTLMLMFTGNWMMSSLMDFTRELYSFMANL